MEISSVQRDAMLVAAAQAQQQEAARTPEARANDRDLVKAVKKLSETGFMGANNELRFIMDRQTGRPLVRIVNKETKEVIQQIPPEYVLRMAEELKQGI